MCRMRRPPLANVGAASLGVRPQSPFPFDHEICARHRMEAGLALSWAASPFAHFRSVTVREKSGAFPPSVESAAHGRPRRGPQLFADPRVER